MPTPRFIKFNFLQIVIFPKIKHQICGSRAVLEVDVQPLRHQELDPNFLKLPMLDRHIIHVSKHVLTL